MKNKAWTKQDVYDNCVLGGPVDEELEKVKQRLIMALRGKPEIIDDVVKFSEAIEKILLWYQWELYDLGCAVNEMMDNYGNIVKVMELYGIDSSEALSCLTQEKLDEEHKHNTENKVYRIPEKTLAGQKAYEQWKQRCDEYILKVTKRSRELNNPEQAI